MALTQWQLNSLATDTIASGDFIAFSDEGESGDPTNKLTIDNLMETGLPLVTEDAIAVASDYILFLDGGATGNTNKEQFADVMTAIAGTGLSASSGVLNIDAAQTGITSVGTIGTGVWAATDIAVAHGGTGASTLNNLITMGTHTTGNYVATVTAGTGLTSDGATSGESVTHSLSVDASQGQITTVGALNAGSITSGFTSIDVGSGGLTTTGAIAGGTIDATTDFTIGDTVVTDGIITDTSGLSVAAATTVTGAFTVGVDDTGHDVKFFGASAGAYMMYDQSEDQLILIGPSADAAGSSGKLLLGTSQTDVRANDILGQIDFKAPAETGTDAITVAASIKAIAQDTFSASVNATDMLFYTGHSEAATEKFRITSQGELGIGGATYGSSGDVLTSGGAGAAPTWATPTVGDITGVTAGVGLSGGGNSGALTITLDLSELSTVTPANGDFFSTLDSDGANEQKTSTTALATLFAGTGLTASSSVIGVDAAQTQITSVGDLGTGTIAAGFGVIDNGTSGIRTNTFTAETSIVPDAASGATLGTTSLEWGHLYIGDDQKIYLGDGQDVSLEYDEDGTDQLRIAGDTIFEDNVNLGDAANLNIGVPLLAGTDHTTTGMTAQMLAGGAIAAFDLVCIHSTTQEVVEADASAAATSRVIGIAPAAISDTATGTVLLQGFVRDDTWTWTTGGALYLSETAGAMTHTAPTTDGAFVQVVGVALSPDVVYINPSMDVIEHA